MRHDYLSTLLMPPRAHGWQPRFGVRICPDHVVCTAFVISCAAFPAETGPCLTGLSDSLWWIRYRSTVYLQCYPFSWRASRIAFARRYNVHWLVKYFTDPCASKVRRLTADLSSTANNCSDQTGLSFLGVVARLPFQRPCFRLEYSYPHGCIGQCRQRICVVSACRRK